ncbi:MAG: TldD/PmbA family protein [Alphaproteobacteria bacterium]|nr:TldD/PmbA family protein [Alphaproteobacteria bacterium]
MTDAKDTERRTLSFLHDLVERARRAGADAADAIGVVSANLSVSQRLGEREDLERAEANDVGLRVFVGQRSANVSTTDMSDVAVRALIERVVAMARLAPEDPHAGLLEANLLAKGPAHDLDLHDPAEPDAETLYARAAAAEDTARAVPGVTNSEGAGASWWRGTAAVAISNGFSGAYTRSSQSVSASVIAGEGTGMETDYDFHSAVYGADLEDPAVIGRRAGERAVQRLKPRKVPSTQVPVVFDPRVSRSLLGHLASAINGQAVARGTSFLKDKMGEAIFAAGINVVDDPHLRRGRSSYPNDGEGAANRKCTIIENGVLTTWLLDRASAHQLGLTTTGHGFRSTSGPPSPHATNFYMAAGQQSPAALMADIDSGFYVTTLIGFGINGVTGDYSRGAAGFWIEKGQIAYPVSEITIAGNLKGMFRRLIPANDLEFRYGTDAPTLRIDGLTVAGT